MNAEGVAQLAAAVREIGTATDPLRIAECDLILRDFQKDRGAWDICFSIVTHAPGQGDVQYAPDLVTFASQTMVSVLKVKTPSITMAMDEFVALLLNDGARQSWTPQIRSNMVRVLVKAMARLCTTEEEADQFFSTVQHQLVGIELPSHDSVLCWVEFLGIIALEYGNGDGSKLPPKQKTLFRIVVRRLSDAIFEQLNTIFQSMCDETHVVTQVLVATEMWVQHYKVPLANIQSIVEPCFSMGPNLFASPEEQLATAAEQLLMAVVDTYNDEESQVAFATYVVQWHIALVPAQAQIHAVCAAASLPFIDMPSFSELYVPLIQGIIEYTHCGVLSCASHMFRFWLRFPDHLKDDETTVLARSGIEALVAQSAYTTGYTLSEEWDEESDFRGSVRTCIREMTQTMPTLGTWLLECAVGTLSQCLQEESVSLQSLLAAEAMLHAISAIAKQLFSIIDVPQDGTESLQNQFLQLCCQVPDHPAILCIVCMLFGVIASYLSSHPHLLHPAVATILRGLVFSEDADTFPMRQAEDHVATIALVKIARLWPDASLIPLLLPLHTDEQIVASLSRTSRLLLWQATCEATNHTDTETFGTVQEVISLPWQSLNDMLDQGSLTHETLETAELLLDMLGVCFKYFRVGQVGTNMCNLISRLLSIEGETATSVAARVAHYVTSQASGWQQLIEGFGKVLEVIVCNPLFEAEAIGVSITNVSCHLDSIETASTSLSVVCKALERWASTEVIVTAALQLVQHHSQQLEALSLSSATMLFRISTQCRFSIPDVFISSGAATFLFDVLVCQPLEAGTFPEDRKLTSAWFGFLACYYVLSEDGGPCLVSQLESPDHVTMAPFLRGINSLYLAASGVLPSWSLDGIMNILRQIVQIHGAETTITALAELMQHPEFARSHLSEAGRQKYLESFHQHVTSGNWQKLKNATKQFCGGKKRGTSGTPSRAGSSTAPSP
eukprot:m.310298 g.310298  ORF g.310298 m.310298 type:complete len:956 (-) comp15949_c0_seq6:4089-6956(-)